MTPPDRGKSILPLQLTSFLGREREIAEVTELLRSSRLLTLTGAGGSGKTRLALEVARRVAAGYPDGVGWVELASLSDPELIPQEIASALGIREEAEGSITNALLGVLQHRSPLLVVDNCEHVVEECAELVDLLLRGAPGLAILATSREALGVAGERAWLVPPLSLPPAGSPCPEQLADSEAVRLFLERARDAHPSFTLTGESASAVAEICRRLDGIPLAIELAAARVKVLSPEQIAQRLDRVFDLLTTGSRTALPRHRTLRAAIDWSYRLLSTSEQRLLQRLSVFSGGFTLDAAEEVCAGGEVEDAEILDRLAALVNRSLVVVREREQVVRYELQETVRQYAKEQWSRTDAGEAPGICRLHALHYLALADAAFPDMERYQRLDVWLPRLRVEQENFRTALHWSLEEEPAIALQLVGRLPYFWLPQPVQWAEGLRWTEAALEKAGASSPPSDLAQAALAAGLLAFLQQDWPRARRHIEKALVVAQEAGDQRLTVLSMGMLPAVMSVQGEPEEGVCLGEEAARLARELDESWFTVAALIRGVASAHRVAGRPAAEEAALREAFELSGRDGYLWGTWESAMHLALSSLERGDVDEAHDLARTAAEAAARMGEGWHGARVLLVLARVVAAEGEERLAGRLLGAVETWLEFTGTRPLPDEEVERERLVAELLAGLGEDGLRQAREEGRGIDLAEALALGTGSDGKPGGEQTSQPSASARDAWEPVVGAREPPRHWLRVAALGPLRISLAGKPVDPATWSHAKPRELLLYLLAHPEGRTREQIGTAFWPEASTGRVKNSFHVLLHKLRKALGSHDVVVIEGERYRIGPEIDVWFDVTAFEEGIDAALRDLRGGDGAAVQLRSALALYRGEFLEGEIVGDWHLEIHDRVRRLYVDGLSALADLQMDAGDLSGAGETLERLVQKEDLREDAYRRLMVCMARDGRRDRALRHYGRLLTLLKNELDAEPEAETRELAARIREAATL